MKKTAVKTSHRAVHRLLTGEFGATASEYAAILAVLVIAVVVSASVVGKELRGGVGHMRSSLAATTPLLGTNNQYSKVVYPPTSAGRLGDSGAAGGFAREGNSNGRFVAPILSVRKAEDE